MAYMIDNETCTSCGACEDECPNKAITHKGKVYSISAAKCVECKGSFDTPQCAEVCPSGSCIPAAA